jgi:hypothetical protein
MYKVIIEKIYYDNNSSEQTNITAESFNIQDAFKKASIEMYNNFVNVFNYDYSIIKY